MGSTSQELIQQLLQAEKQAEEIITNAKKNRLTKLRQAKDKAEEELKDFREKEEARFQKETGTKTSANPADSLKVSTQTEIDGVHQDYAKNKVKTIQYVVSKVLEVPATLSDTQKQALKTGAI